MHVNADTAICEYYKTVKLCLLENLCKTSSVDKIKKFKKWKSLKLQANQIINSFLCQKNNSIYMLYCMQSADSNVVLAMLSYQFDFEYFDTKSPEVIFDWKLPFSSSWGRPVNFLQQHKSPPKFGASDQTWLLIWEWLIVRLVTPKFFNEKKRLKIIVRVWIILFC